MGQASAATRWHYFRPDPAAGRDIRGRRYCCCGVVEGNARHPYPATPSGADHAQRAAGDRDDQVDDMP